MATPYWVLPHPVDCWIYLSLLAPRSLILIICPSAYISDTNNTPTPHPPANRVLHVWRKSKPKRNPSQIPPLPKPNRKGAHRFIASALKKAKGGEYWKTSKYRGNHWQFQRDYLCSSHFSSPNMTLAIYQTPPRWILPLIFVAEYMPRLNSAIPRGILRISRDRS